MPTGRLLPVAGAIAPSVEDEQAKSVENSAEEYPADTDEKVVVDPDSFDSVDKKLKPCVLGFRSICVGARGGFLGGGRGGLVFFREEVKSLKISWLSEGEAAAAAVDEYSAEDELADKDERYENVVVPSESIELNEREPSLVFTQVGF